MGGTLQASAIKHESASTANITMNTDGSTSFPDGTSQISAAQHSFRNKFINGKLDFWQRGTSQVFSGAGVILYVADRWSMYSSGTGTSHTYSRQNFTTGQTDVPGNPRYYLRNAITNGGDSVAGGIRFRQHIEDVSTLAGKGATLSFWAKADSIKNLSIEISQYFGTGGSPSAEVRTFIQKITISTTWTKYTVQINVPSISGKTIGSDGANTSALVIWFWMSAGSNNNASTGTLGIQTGTFDFAMIQLEEGAIATAFEDRPYGLELSLCQRYYQKTYDIDVPPASANTLGAPGRLTEAQSNYSSIQIAFKTTMRIVPTVTMYNPVTGAQGTMRSDAVDVAVRASRTGTFGCFVHANNATVGNNAEIYVHITADAEF